MFLRVAVPKFAYSAVSLVLAAAQAVHACSESVLISENVLLLSRWDYFAELETGLPDSTSADNSLFTYTGEMDKSGR